MRGRAACEGLRCASSLTVSAVVRLGEVRSRPCVTETDWVPVFCVRVGCSVSVVSCDIQLLASAAAALILAIFRCHRDIATVGKSGFEPYRTSSWKKVQTGF